MKDISEYHEKYSKDLDAEDLEEVALYIEHYVEKLVDTYDVNADQEQIEEASVNLYQTLLGQIDESVEKMESNPQSILSDILEDLDSGGDRAAGDMMALIGKAGTEEETRHPVITVLAKRIVDHHKSKYS